MEESNISAYFSSLSIRRRSLLKTALSGTAGVSLASALAACGGSSTTPTGATGEGSFPSHPQWNFVFVNHVTTNPFFVPTQYGILDASALVGCKYQWTGSENSIVAEMVDKMNAAIDRKSTRLNSSHGYISYAVFCLKKKKRCQDY